MAVAQNAFSRLLFQLQCFSVARPPTGYYASNFSAAPFLKAIPDSDCNIQGNISIATDEPIYHIPGQKILLAGHHQSGIR
jgi:hypothetical protein